MGPWVRFMVCSRDWRGWSGQDRQPYQTALSGWERLPKRAMGGGVAYKRGPRWRGQFRLKRRPLCIKRERGAPQKREEVAD